MSRESHAARSLSCLEARGGYGPVCRCLCEPYQSPEVLSEFMGVFQIGVVQNHADRLRCGVVLQPFNYEFYRFEWFFNSRVVCGQLFGANGSVCGEMLIK